MDHYEHHQVAPAGSPKVALRKRKRKDSLNYKRIEPADPLEAKRSKRGKENVAKANSTNQTT